MTALLNDRLHDFLEIKGYLGPEQTAFRPGFSTLDNMLTLHVLIEFYKSKGKKLYCAFIDYEKAFDTVNRSSLWTKMIENGINGKILRVIMNLYSKAKSCVRQGGELSSMFPSYRGVRQGENLSPLLFALYLNDLKNHLSHCYEGLPLAKNLLPQEEGTPFPWSELFLLLYANDTVILAETAEELQKGLNGLKSYCDKWHLKVNIAKTKVMVFSKGRIQKKPSIMYGDSPLEVTDNFVYLGLNFYCSGSFKPATEMLTKQANNAMFALLSKGRKLSLPIDIMLHLFDSTILPILLYGCEIWGYENYSAANKLYTKFCKILLGLKSSTNTCLVYGELGRLPLYHHINKRIISFWSKTVTDERRKISGMLLKSLIHRSCHSSCISPPWLLFVRSLLDKAGMSYVWHNPDTVCSRYLKKSYAMRSNDVCKQMWKSEVYNSTKCKIFQVIGKELRFEEYLTKLPWSIASSLCRIRTSNHRFPIETGRYCNIPRNERKCQKCDTGEIGDEIHYILSCPSFSVERSKLLMLNHNECAETNVKKLLLAKDKHILLSLGKFLTVILKTF